jgi:hypothetical protein
MYKKKKREIDEYLENTIEKNKKKKIKILKKNQRKIRKNDFF